MQAEPGLLTKGWYDDDLCALSDELSESFGEGEIPANEETDRAKRRLNHFVKSVRAGS